MIATVSAWLIARIGPRAFKLLPYLAALAGLVALYLYVDHRGYEKGEKHERHLWQPVLRDLATERANVASLRAAVDAQNAASLAAKAASDKAQKVAQDALGRALASDRAAQGLRARADALAHRAGPPCVSVEGDKLSKEAWGRI